MKRLLLCITMLAWPCLASAAGSDLELRVLPTDFIVVDDEERIILVVTNAGNTPDPVVHQGNETGKIIPFSSQIKQRYIALSPLIDYSFSGVVYGPLQLQEKAHWWDELAARLQGFAKSFLSY